MLQLLIAFLFCIASLTTLGATEKAPPIFSSIAPPEESSLSVSPWRISAGPGAIVYAGTYNGRMPASSTGLGLNFSALKPLESRPQIWLGADMAFYLWMPSSSALSFAGATAVHLLPTALYYFASGLAPNLHPYFGVAAGPHFVLPKAASAALFFELLFRVGVEWQASNELAFIFEPKMGVLDGNFVALPQINLGLNFG